MQGQTLDVKSTYSPPVPIRLRRPCACIDSVEKEQGKKEESTPFISSADNKSSAQDLQHIHLHSRSQRRNTHTHANTIHIFLPPKLLAYMATLEGTASRNTSTFGNPFPFAPHRKPTSTVTRYTATRPSLQDLRHVRKKLPLVGHALYFFRSKIIHNPLHLFLLLVLLLRRLAFTKPPFQEYMLVIGSFFLPPAPQRKNKHDVK